jgi:hypothetical protein
VYQIGVAEGAQGVNDAKNHMGAVDHLESLGLRLFLDFTLQLIRKSKITDWSMFL